MRLTPSGVHLVQRQKALQGKVGVELLYLAAVGDSDAGGASGRYDVGVSFPEFVAGTPDQGVQGAGVAVDETAADGVGGVGGYDPGRLFFEVHARELGRPFDERLQRDVEAGEYRAAEVAAFAVDGLDRRSRPDVDDDGGETVVPAGRHRVDDPVGPDGPGVVVAVV